MLTKHQSLTSISSASDSIYAKQPSYVPDFNLKALENTQYLKIARSHYVAARRATLMERQPKTPDADSITGEDVFSKEWKRAISVNAAVPGETDSIKTLPSMMDGDSSTGRSRAATNDSILGGGRPRADSDDVGVPLMDETRVTIPNTGSNGKPSTPTSW